MKIRLLLALVAAAISFATLDFGQQTDAIDPQTDQQIRALTMSYEEALNEHDAPAAAAFFTEDAAGNVLWSPCDREKARELPFSSMAYQERGH